MKKCKKRIIIFVTIVLSLLMVQGIINADMYVGIYEPAFIGVVTRMEGRVTERHAENNISLFEKDRDLQVNDRIHAGCTIITGENALVEIKLLPEMVGVDNARSTIILESGTECQIEFDDTVLSDRNPGEKWDDWYKYEELWKLVEEENLTISLSFSDGSVRGYFTSAAVKYFDLIEYEGMQINLIEGSGAEFSIKHKDTAVINEDFVWQELTTVYKDFLLAYEADSYEELSEADKQEFKMYLEVSGMMTQLKNAKPSMAVVEVKDGQLVVNTEKGLNPSPEMTIGAGGSVKYLYGWGANMEEMEEEMRDKLPSVPDMSSMQQPMNPDSSGGSDSGKSQDDMPLDLEVNVIKERPDMAEAMKAEMMRMTARMMEEQGGDISPEMMKFEVWVYEIEEDVETALENHDWPYRTQKTPLETKTVDESIEEALNDPEMDAEEMFSRDWVERARKAADRYRGVEYKYKSFSFLGDGMCSYIVSVMSPCLNMETLEFVEGTVLTIGKVSFNMGGMGMPPMAPPGMGD